MNGTIPVFHGGSGENVNKVAKEGDEIVFEWNIPTDEYVPLKPSDIPVAEAIPVNLSPEDLSHLPVAEALPVETPAKLLCPVCQSEHDGRSAYCSDCGYYFSPEDLLPSGVPSAAPAPVLWLQDRYEVGARINDRNGVERFHALDHGDKTKAPVPVIVVRQALVPAATSIEQQDTEILPSFDDPATIHIQQDSAVWPCIAWERQILKALATAGPMELAHFEDAAYEYLIEEVPDRREALGRLGRCRSGWRKTFRSFDPSGRNTSDAS